VQSQDDGQPRYQGTLYGVRESAEIAPPAPVKPENSGSLTGQILAQGRSDEARRTRGTTARLILGLLIGLGILVTIGLLVVAGVGGVFDPLFGRLLGD
jgi:hypothetical protein